jgi:hypothetical protein
MVINPVSREQITDSLVQLAARMQKNKFHFPLPFCSV